MSDGRGSEFVMMFHTFVLADLYPALVDEHMWIQIKRSGLSRTHRFYFRTDLKLDVKKQQNPHSSWQKEEVITR